MDSTEEYTALSWFVAGFLRAGERLREPPSNRKDSPPQGQIRAALSASQRALEDYRAGACLGCRREGIVLLDGQFCPKCYPQVGEVIDDGE